MNIKMIWSHTYRRFWHTHHWNRTAACMQKKRSTIIITIVVQTNYQKRAHPISTNACDKQLRMRVKKWEKIPLSHSIHLLPDISRADAHQRPRILSIVFGVSECLHLCLLTHSIRTHSSLSVLLTAPTAPIFPHVDLSILLVLVLWGCVHALVLAWMHECLDGINEHLIDVQSSHDKRRRNDKDDDVRLIPFPLQLKVCVSLRV